MKYMETINEMQVLFTKLRREIQRGEAPRCTCSLKGVKKDEFLSAMITPCPVHGTKGKHETATEAVMHEELDRHLRYQVECRALYNWLNGKTDKKPSIADRVLEKLLASTKAADFERKSLKFMREFFKANPQMFQGVKPEDIPTVGGCTCVSGVVGEDCPEHGKAGGCIVCGFKHPKLHPAFATGISKDVIDKLIKHPDLPLHVRVAKANGHACWTDREGIWRSHLGRFIPEGVEYPIIPDYPNDLVAAMGALEEYVKIHSLFVEIHYHVHQTIYQVNLAGSIQGSADSLPQAVCEAIVAHSEEK